MTASFRANRYRLGHAALALAAVLAQSLLSFAARAETITVYTAASTVDIMSKAAHLFEDGSGHRVRLSVAASSVLARQIENGAPADIYLSANVRWMDYLAERGLIENDSRRDLLRNSLVLIAPSDEIAGQAPAPSGDGALLDPSYPFAAAVGPNRLALADPDHVPAGIYARQALEKLGAWPKVRDRVARAQNVRAALMLVARGEVAAGIVYRSDALATDNVHIIGRFPNGSHDSIVYPVAVVKNRHSPAVDAFLGHLFGQPCRGIFLRHGFILPGD